MIWENPVLVEGIGGSGKGISEIPRPMELYHNIIMIIIIINISKKQKSIQKKNCKE